MSTTSGPTRVAFCITDLDPGGAERALVQLVTRLDRRRWLPAVYALSGPGALVGELQKAGIPVVCLGARRARDVGVVARLAGELKTFKPDILQTFLFHANLAGRIAGRLARVKRIVSGIRVAERRTRIHLWLDRMTNWMVDRNVCVSDGVAAFSIRVAKLRPEKTIVIPNGVDVPRFAAAEAADLMQFGIPHGSPVLIAVGRLDPQKGLPDLLQAMRGVAARNRDVHLLLVGEGPQRTWIETWIRENQLAGRVHLTGWRDDVPRLLRSAFCLVLSSLWEGMPNVVLEAMAAGLPVVATRIEGTAELVLENTTGLLVPPGSPAELEAAIAALIDNPDLARKMGQAGKNRVESEFSWDKTAASYAELYDTLLQNCATA